jgi:hypothetical protein
VGSDYTAHEVGPVQVCELHPGVTYRYAVVATNSVGTTIDRTGARFTTSMPTAPIVVTEAAVEVTQTTAVIVGVIDAQGLQTSYEFELRTEAASYFPQGFTSTGSAPGAHAVSSQLSYLAAGVIYHHRLCASNQDGTVCGADQTFATPSVPNPLIPPAAPPLLTTPAESPAHVGVMGRLTTKALTNAQKRAKALQACKKDRKRAACEKQPGKQYAVKHKATSKTK